MSDVHHENDFKTLFESAPGLYLVLKPDFSIFAVSNPYLAATNTKREDILGKNLFKVFPDNPEDPDSSGTENLNASLNRVLKNKEPDVMAIQKYDIPIPGSNKFEERHWSSANFPVFGPEKELRFIIHSVQDVTDFVRLRREGMERGGLKRELATRTEQVAQLEKLRQSQKLEAMGQLAGGVAHDFNNILAAILTQTAMISELETIDSTLRSGIEQITRSAERAARLTRQLLAFSRNQVLQPKAVNLNSIVEEIQTMLRRLLREDIQLKTKLASDLKSTIVDSGQMEQVILNLVLNAQDAIPHGGQILIETSNETVDKGLAHGLMKISPGDYVLLRVQDTGIGMDPATQARLFEPYFTTKAIGKGTGLGLATVYGIVEQNHGAIWVYSEIGKGTTFKIYLPRSDQAIEALSSAKPIEPRRGRGETIILAEDQDDLREPLAAYLKSKGYLVHQANNGVAALRLAQSLEGRFDLIISDVIMPEMGGPEMAAEIWKLYSDKKVIFLSGYTDDVLENRNYLGRGLEFLEKPFSLQALLLKIQTVIGK